MKSWSIATIILLMGVSLSMQANEINIGLNEHTISTEIELELNKNANAVLGYTYAENGGDLASGALHMTHKAGVHHIEVGGKFSYIWSDKSANGGVIGLGGRYEMELGSNLSLNVAGYYAPSVLSFDHIDGQYEFDTHLKFMLNPSLGVFVGYQNIKLKYDEISNVTFDNGFYLGATFGF